MKNLIPLILIILSGLKLSAQETQAISLRDFSPVPPSPEVSAILDYKEPDVSYSSGLPIIDLPVFTINEGSLSLPISFHYLSGGIRASQEASSAGLGWCLEPAAVVARTVYGLPDELNELHKGLKYLDAPSKSLLEYTKNMTADHDPTDDNFLTGDYSQAMEWATSYYNGLVDMANDVFSVSGLGLSATFIFDYNSIPVRACVSSRNGIELQYASTVNPLEYTVTNANGLHYVFGERETTELTCRYGDPELEQHEKKYNYISAWHLTKYYNDNGDTITFKYAARTPRTRNYGSQVNHNVTNPMIVSCMPRKVNSTGFVKYTPKVLSEIESSSCRVKFTYHTLANADVISKIEVFPKNGSSIAAKTIIPIYDHKFNTILRGDVTIAKPILEELQENDKTIYKFDYYNQQGDWTNQYFDGVDFGGYPNGEDNGNNLVPSVGVYQGDAANRNINPDYAYFGSLKSITYATGGSTEFEWESNQAGYLKQASLNQSSDDVYYTYLKTDTLCAIRQEGYEKLIIENYRIQGGQRYFLDLTRYFLMSESNYWVDDYFHEHFTYTPAPYPRVCFYKQGEATPILTYFLDNKTINVDHHGEPIELSLPQGVYTVKLEDPTSINHAEDDLEREFATAASVAGRVYLSRYAKGSQTLAHNSRLWFGLRIKRMTSNALTGSIYRDYYYPYPDSSSGVVEDLPQYDYHWYLGKQSPVMPGIAWTEVFSISESGLPQTPLGQSQIIYGNVITRLGLSDRNRDDNPYLYHSSRRYRFSTSRTFGYEDYNFTQYLGSQSPASRMNTSRALLRGLPLSEDVNTGNDMPYSQISRNYNIYQPDETPVFTTDLFTISTFKAAPIDTKIASSFYGIGKYTLIPYNITVSSERVTDEFGAQSTRQYKYFFDDYTNRPDYALTRSISTTESAGTAINQYFTYRKAGRFFTPDVEVNFAVRGNTIVSGSRNEYAPNTSRLIATYTPNKKGASASGLIPADQNTTEALRSLFSEPEFSYKYDDAGHLCEIRCRGTVLASYIWGYGGQYPVIEAEGISYENLKEAAGNLVNEASASEDIRVRNLGAKLRQSFPGKEISTISYHWLFGMASFTDSRGHTTSYTYDDNGRLTSVSDFNNYLIKRYEYHDQFTL